MNAIGVDLGATNLRVALGDNDGNILKKMIERTDIRHGPEGIANQIIRLINSFSVDHDEIKGIGIGSIGPLDINRGIILSTPNLPFHRIPIREPLEKAFKLPLQLLNDCNAAVIGEKIFGLGRRTDNLAYVTISSGIGCGVYVNGTLILGKDGNAAEMGHTCIDMSGALMCGCGKRGHWEAYCSGNNIPNYLTFWIKKNQAQTTFEKSTVSLLSNRTLGNVTAKMVYDSAKAGDTLSLKILENIGRLNAIGIANVITAYDPELITIGGSVTLNNKRMVLEPIKRLVKDFSVNRVPDIEITPLGYDIVLYGAIAMNFIDL
jgi:glucokinase